MAATSGEEDTEEAGESKRAPPKALAPNSAEAEEGLSVEATTAGESSAPAWSTERRRRQGLAVAAAAEAGAAGAAAAAEVQKRPAATPAAVAASAAAKVTSA